MERISQPWKYCKNFAGIPTRVKRSLVISVFVVAVVVSFSYIVSFYDTPINRKFLTSLSTNRLGHRNSSQRIFIYSNTAKALQDEQQNTSSSQDDSNRENGLFINRKNQIPSQDEQLDTTLASRGHNNNDDAIHTAGRPVQILISSYMRSGSTFLGSLLGWREDAFYWFEPLWSTHQNVFINSDGTKCHYAKLQCTVPRSFENDVRGSMEFMKDVYACDFAKHYSRVQGMLKPTAFKHLSGPSWDEYRSCGDLNKQVCLKKLESVCTRKQVHVTKLLRADLEISSQLLKTVPGLKIIHLFRDPRGQLNSHLHTGWYPVTETKLDSVREDVKVVCDRMRRDLEVAKHLVKEFPNRVKILQYEDFTDTYDKVDLLYKFLNINFTNATRHMVFDLEGVGGEPNAGFHPFNYRETLPWSNVEIANKHCRDIYRELGLTEFTNERDLRDESISPVTNTLPYAL